MKPLYSYIRSLYTGIPFEDRRPSNNQTLNAFSPSRTHRTWYCFRSTRSLLLPRKRSKHNHGDTNDPVAGAKERSSFGGSWKRQYTWRHPLPEMSWRAFTGRQSSEVELPMQGIEKSLDATSGRKGSRAEGSKAEGQDFADNDLGFLSGVDDDMDEVFGLGDALDDPAGDHAAIDAGGVDEREHEDSHRERKQLDRSEEGGTGDQSGDAGTFAEETEEGAGALVAVADDGDDNEDGVAGAGEALQDAVDAVFGFVELGDDAVVAADADVVGDV
ncbi:MAG: hypothetical protein L6R42_007047 [Xanthoria sp. 1 TBL-2021]|nr:MAG: hypothetical protein L6R42_007047 [Xanthoria sp. 1 TBL-2021]